VLVKHEDGKQIKDLTVKVVRPFGEPVKTEATKKHKEVRLNRSVFPSPVFALSK
jgi:hypothetical protein